MRYAIIEDKTRKVVNVVQWEGAEWLPPRDHHVVFSETAGIGWNYDEKTNSFSNPFVSEPDQG